MDKNESKYFKTAIKMDEAFISLLDKKDFEYITIKEICEVAGVNRSTFYLHYENVCDLLEETTRYVIDKHLSYYSLDTKRIALRFEDATPRELMFVTEEYLTPYLTFIKENQRIFKVAIRRFNTMHMGKVYEEMFTHIFSPILSRFRVPEQEHPYVMKFYLSGIFAIVMEWLDRDCTDRIEDVIKVIIDCVMGERNLDLS